jgi:hypothetical protein
MHANANAFTESQPPWYAHRWPWLLALGPAAVLVAGAFTSWLAVTRPDALVVGDYYKQGKAINQDLRRDLAATAMKLSLRAHYDAAQGRLDGQLTSAGQAFAAPFRILLVHPTQPTKDVTLLAWPRPDGRFSVGLPMLAGAHWQVVVEDARRDWRLAHSWDWPRTPGLAIDADEGVADHHDVRL